MNYESGESLKSILIDRCKFLTVIVITLLLDAAFVLAWVWVHYLLQKAVTGINPEGNERIVAYFLRTVFDVPTLVIVVVYIVSDSIRIVRRIAQWVREDVRREPRTRNAANATSLHGEESKRQTSR
jgi:hypothetical protein